jgi:hypothetical protein
MRRADRRVRLASVEFGKRFRRGGQSLQFVQMLYHDVAQQAVHLGRSQMNLSMLEGRHDLLQFGIEQDHQTPREIWIGCLQVQEQMPFVKPARERVRKTSSPVVRGFSSIKMSCG